MKRLARAALMASAFVMVSTTVSLAMSGPTPHSTPSREGTSTSGGKVTKEVAVALTAAQTAAKAGDMQTALSEIKVAQAVPDLTAHDIFEINIFLSVVAANLKDYPTAAKAYDELVTSPEFPAMADTDKQPIYYDALAVNENIQNWKAVVTYGQLLEPLKGNNDSTYAAMAVAYYTLNGNKINADAVTYAQKSIDMANAAGKKPDENAQKIVLNNESASNPTAAAKMMEDLVVNSNNPEDWAKIIDFSFNTKGIKPIDALYLYRLKFSVGGMATADDYTILASLANQQGYPTEAERALNQGMNSGKLTAGQAGPELTKARKGAADDERNLATYAASAAKAKSGEQDAKMAEDYWGYGRYADAEAAARSAISKGGLKDTGEAQLILGLALVAQDKNDDAIQTLSQISGNAGRTRAAHLWSLRAQAKKKQAGGAPAAAH